MEYEPRGEFVELEFHLSDDAYPAVAVSRETGCRLELLETVSSAGADGTVTQFLRVESGRPDATAECVRAAAFGVEAAVVAEQSGGGAVVELTATRGVADALAEASALLQSAVVDGGTARYVAVVPPTRSPADAISAVRDGHPAVTLAGKRRCGVPTSLRTARSIRLSLEARLTDRQWSALRLAFEGGYFERPRGRTQAELAEEMAVSPSTYGQHLTVALEKLLDTLLADAGPR